MQLTSRLIGAVISYAAAAQAVSGKSFTGWDWCVKFIEEMMMVADEVRFQL